jgi:glycosyltransferase involved in cell wall biosynthesis
MTLSPPISGPPQKNARDEQMPLSADISEIRVSCLMVTLATPERFPFLQRSIAAYCGQTHGRKELVVVANGGTEGGRQNVLDYIRSLGRNDIRAVTVDDQRTVGEYRNVSVEHAVGDVLCQWDDDDLYHAERIARQLAALVEGDHDANLLRQVLKYFPESRELYWTNWHATEGGGHPGTLMIKRSVPLRYLPIHYPPGGPSARRGEDLAAALFLKEHYRVSYLADMPYLFIYVSHGKNLWPDEFHRMLATELSVSQGFLRRREAELRAQLKNFDFGSGDLFVKGSNGSAFTI